MNKYEEALAKIEEFEIDLREWLAFVNQFIKDNNGTITIGDILDGNLSDEWLSLVTLTNRATQMQPIHQFIDYYICPICHSSVTGENDEKYNFCPSCGQAIKWGNKNEQV